MKKIFPIFLGLVILSQIVMAAVEDVDCFKYYEFQSGLVFDDLMAEKVSYSPGDEVVISYSLFSQMESPIVEGSVRVQIFYNDPIQGEQMIDEFFAEKGINLMYNDVVEKEFTWTVPSGAKSGEYIVKTYFIVGDFFNLAGLSILPYGPPGVPGEMTTFDVKSTTASRIYFSKDDTYLNDKKYEFGVPTTAYESVPIKIKTKLVNEGPAKQVNVKLTTYEWDDATDKAIDSYTVEKTISLGANSKEEITYELPALSSATYQIKFTATTGDEKSILKLRVPITGAKGRFIYLGLDKFPLIKGQKTTLFMCMSGSTDYSSVFNGKGTLEISDASGNSILKEGYGPFEVVSTPMGKMLEFTPTKNLNYLVLNADLYDDKGNLHDKVSLVYDYSKFASVPGNLAIKLAKDSIKQGEEIPYTITYTDNLGMPLNGKILIYVTDPEEKIIQTVKDKKISGSFNGKILISGNTGDYKIKVRELTQDKKAEASFTVTEKITPAVTTTTIKEVTTTIKTVEIDKGFNYLWIVALVIILIIVAILWRYKK